MRKFEFLSPSARAIVRHLKSLEQRGGQEFALPAIIIGMRKQGVAIGQTLNAINECCAADWMARQVSTGREPDRVALTNVASVALSLEAAE